MAQSENFDDREQLYAIGIEAGLVPIPMTISGYLDYQFCAILDKDHKLSIGSGGGWEYPSEVIQQILSYPTLEIGAIMARISGDSEIKYKHGAIGFYSKNFLTRPIITEQCIEMALIPFLNPEIYFNKIDVLKD